MLPKCPLFCTVKYYLHISSSHVCRKAWIALGEMIKEDAQLEIIKSLEAVDPNMKDVVLEQWLAKQTSEREDKTRCVATVVCSYCACM